MGRLAAATAVLDVVVGERSTTLGPELGQKRNRALAL